MYHLRTTKSTKLSKCASKLTSPFSGNKRNGEPTFLFSNLLDEWAEYFKEFLNTNSALNTGEVPAAE